MKNRNIGKSASILVVAKMIPIMVSMIVAMILSRVFTLEEYGTYSQIMLIINLTVTIFALGLPNSINYFVAKEESNEKKELFTSVYYTLIFLLGIVGGLSLVISTPLISAYFKNPIINTVWFVFLILPLSKMLLSSIDNFLVVYWRMKKLAKFKILNSIFILITALFVIFFKLNFVNFFLFLSIVYSVFAVISILKVKEAVGNVKITLDKKTIKNIFKFSLPIGLATLIGTINIQLDKLFIGRVFDTEKLAIYTNAAKELPVAIIATSLTAILLPYIVNLLNKKREKEALNLWSKTTLLSYIFMCFFVSFIFVNAKEVITILYSEKYIYGTAVFQIYTLVLVFRTTYFGIILNSLGKTNYIMYSSIATLVLNVILNYVLYLMLGFIGPAVATLISIFLVAGFQLHVTTKFMKTKFRKLFEWKKIFFVSIINIALAIIYIIPKKSVISLGLNQYTYLTIFGSIWALIYYIILKKEIMVLSRSLKEGE